MMRQKEVSLLISFGHMDWDLVHVLENDVASFADFPSIC